jgi:hypothetical protein
MRLLGNFPSQLSSSYYADLLALVNQQIAVGEYAGGSTFDAAAVAALQAQGQTFTALAIPSSGDRAIADSVNTPMNLINVRFEAIQSEVTYLKTEIASLAASLANQTSLLDQLLGYTQGSSWASTLPQLGSASTYSWDFSGGFSAISADIPSTDPVSGIVYSAVPALSTILNTTTGLLQSGVSVPVTPRTFPPKNLTWLYSTPGQSAATYGPDWADLDILESEPRLVFNPIPTIQPAAAVSLFSVTGTQPGGSVPIYVNLNFVARQSETTIVIAADIDDVPPAPVNLTPYRVEAENTVVRANGVVYVYGVDFNVTVDGYLSPVDLPVGVPLTVDFEEYYPAYQCSVDQVNWSQMIMLDPNRPYPDGTTTFGFLGVKNSFGSSLFPLTNETGVLTGMYIEMIGIPATEMIFSVTTPASEVYGMPAQLQIDMDRPAYMTGVAVSPYTNYPQTLTTITCQGVTGAPVVLFQGSVLIDRPMVLSFPRTSVRSLTLSFTQENYTIKQYSVATSDKLRRNTLNSLQSVLPFAIRTVAPVPPTLFDGALYAFGFESILGVDWSSTTIPGVFVTGAYRIAGQPQILRVDTTTIGSVDTWLYSKSYSSTGQLVATNLTGTQLTSGAAIPVPITYVGATTPIAYTDYYLKYILRSVNAMVFNFFLQVTNV